MKEYYVYSDGKEKGPFSLLDLQRQGLTPEALVRTGVDKQWRPFSSIDVQQSMMDARARKGPASKFSFGWIASISLLAIAICVAAYFLSGKPQGNSGGPKEDVKMIHEREVRKAIEERKQSKKNELARKELLTKHKSELRSLDAQLKNVNARRAAALAELDDIRRPHLFRSRSKKEEQVAEQLQIVESLEAKAAGIRSKKVRCQLTIDSLAGLTPP